MDVVNLRDSIKYIIALSTLLWFSVAVEAVDVCSPVLPCKVDFNPDLNIDNQSFSNSGDGEWFTTYSSSG
jgi:hypothetical protein